MDIIKYSNKTHIPLFVKEKDFDEVVSVTFELWRKLHKETGFMRTLGQEYKDW